MGANRVEKLLSLFDQDKSLTGTNDRYPNRFAFVTPTCDLFADLQSLVAKKPIKIVRLSEYLKDDDYWITWFKLRNDLFDLIKNSHQDLLVIGFSEYLRGLEFRDVEKAIIDIAGLESSPEQKAHSMRCVFVMTSMHPMIRQILDKDLVRSKFYKPILDLTASETVSLSAVPKISIDETPSSNCHQLVTVKGYLDLVICLDGKPSSIVISSKTLINLFSLRKDYLQDPTFPFLLMIDPEEIIRQQAPALSLLLDHMPSDLINRISNELKKTSSKIVKPLDVVSLLLPNTSGKPDEEFYSSALFSGNVEDRKAAQLFFSMICDQEEPLSSYYHVLGLLDYDSFDIDVAIASIYSRFIEEQIIENFKPQRLQTINWLQQNNWFGHEPKGLDIETLFDKAWELHVKKQRPYSGKTYRINGNLKNDLQELNFSQAEADSLISDFSKTYCEGVLTISTREERLQIIKLASLSILNQEQIKSLYPSLASYLSLALDDSLPEKQTPFKQYLYEYISSKIGNSATDGLKSFLDGQFKGTSSLFYKWYYDPTLAYKPINGKVDHVFVLDGVGAEYLWLIIRLIEKKTNRIPSEVSFKASRLPTITSINKAFLQDLYPQINDSTWLSQYDSQVIHGEFYKPSQNVEKALTIIDSMIDHILKTVKNGPFVITADHGSTIMPRLIPTKNTKPYADAEHEGRCCKVMTFTGESDSYAHGFIEHQTDDGQKWILAFGPHTLSNMPKHECHGGASPEEVLVPWLRYDSVGEFKYSLIPVSTVVSGLNREISFKLSPRINDASQVYVIDGLEKRLSVVFNGSLFTCELTVGQRQTVTVCIGDQRIQLEVTSSGGITEEEDLFS